MVATITGIAFFLLPVNYGGKITVPFDVAVTFLRNQFPFWVEVYTFLLVLSGGVFSLLVRWRRARLPGWVHSAEFETSRTILVFRLLGGLLSVLFVAHLLPSVLYRAGIYQLIWKILAVSVAVIIPLGAIFVQLFVVYGGMEFLGTLSESLMRPLFKLPGRAALDALTSWVGSYSVGLYLTRTVFLRNGYNRREAFTIATCFSTVSIGFVGVVCSTLNILHLFPLVVMIYFVAVVLLAAILVRIPPISRIGTDYLGEVTQTSENAGPADEQSVWRRAWARAIGRAAQAPPFLHLLPRAVGDGLRLAASIIGTIVSIGTLALIIAKFTPVFKILGIPLIPVLKGLGLPQPDVLAPAVLVEITEMYIPSLLVVNTPEVSRFFIAVLSVSQLIFFSSLGPMIIDMFRDIPVRFVHLIWLFLIRTAILLPLLAGLIAALVRLGVLSTG